MEYAGGIVDVQHRARYYCIVHVAEEHRVTIGRKRLPVSVVHDGYRLHRKVRALWAGKSAHVLTEGVGRVILVERRRGTAAAA